MKAVIEALQTIEWKIEWEKEELEKAVADFRDSASKYDAYGIETFVPGKVERIANHRARLQALAEQKAMLEFLLAQNQ